MKSTLRFAVLTVILVISAGYAFAGPGAPIPMPPTRPPMIALMLHGPGAPIPMPPTRPPMIAGPGAPIPMPPTRPPSVG